jgi:hypothetical protein
MRQAVLEHPKTFSADGRAVIATLVFSAFVPRSARARFNP